MNNCFIVFNHNEHYEKIDVRQVEKMMEKNLDGECCILGIAVESDGVCLEASWVGGDEFPGIDVNAMKDNKTYYTLMGAELANSDNPFITTRLYAGNAELETDSPVAFMAHGERKENDDSRRIVYADYDLVKVESDHKWGDLDRSQIMLTEESPVNLVKNRYIVTMDASYIRDSQVFCARDKNLSENDMDEDWRDFSAPAYLGIVEAANKVAAIHQIADQHDLPIDALNAEEI